jgi:hypothetical protein
MDTAESLNMADIALDYLGERERDTRPVAVFLASDNSQYSLVPMLNRYAGTAIL